MDKQLKDIYPSLIKYNQTDQNLPDDYRWFINEQNEIIGIQRAELTEKDEALLTLFLKEYTFTLPDRSIEEQRWYTYIQDGTEIVAPHPFRFIYFSIQHQGIDAHSFKEAINELFGRMVPIIWLNETDGVLIEELTVTSESMDYEQIIDIIMTDFYAKIKFFIGETKNCYEDLSHYYETTLKSGQFVFQIANKEVINYIEAIPYVILHTLDQTTKNDVIESMLKEFKDDEEMLHTIQNFLLHNLNVSETAKQMYMHRNSLQYRIDKFIQVTGINIQQFDEAMSVQLALHLKHDLI